MTGHHTATTDRTDAPAAAREAAVLLRADITQVLDDLLVQARLVRSLTTSRQRGLGFLTTEGRKALDAQIVADRRHRRTQPDRHDLGLDWLNRGTVTAGSGHVRAPGTMPAIDMDAQLWFTLTDLTRRTIRRLDDSGLCIIRPLPPEPDTGDLITHLQALTGTVTAVPYLQHMLRDLEKLTEQADVVVNGDSKANLDNCPHCGRPTLVVYFRDEIVRCDRDPHSGHYELCVCRDEFCDCKRKPITHRHQWWRNPQVAPSLMHTWSALNNLLVPARRDTSPKETKPS